MNRKQLILLVVALAIVGGASLLLINRHQESWTESDAQLGGKLLQNFQVNDVSAIHIKGDGDLDLVRKNDRWQVQERDGYPANFTQIGDLLIKLSNLKIIQSEPVDNSELPSLHLEQPGHGTDAATLLEFKNDHGSVIASLLVGKKHMQKSSRPASMPWMQDGFADGRYVMLTSDPKDVLTISDPLDSVSPKAAEWLNKDFFKVDAPRSISFVSTNAAESWTVTRASESSPWVLADVKKGETVDTNKLSSLASTLSWPSFVDVAADPAKAMAKPLEVVIKTFDHFTYTLKIGSKTPDNNYDLQVAVAADLPAQRTPGKNEKPDEKKKLDADFQQKNKQLQAKLAQEKELASWTYEVNGWLVDPLVRDRAQLMVDKKDEKKTAKNEATPAPEADAPMPVSDVPFDSKSSQ